MILVCWSRQIENSLLVRGKWLNNQITSSFLRINYHSSNSLHKRSQWITIFILRLELTNLFANSFLLHLLRMTHSWLEGKFKRRRLKKFIKSLEIYRSWILNLDKTIASTYLMHALSLKKCGSMNLTHKIVQASR